MSAADSALEAGRAPATGRTIDLSIVIVVYRTPDFLRRCLDSIAAAGLAFSWEVIVVDNAPGEEGCGPVTEGREGVVYVPNAKNVGFGRGCNQGMRLARGRHYLLLNPDMEVSPGSLEALLSYLESEPDVGLVAPRLHYADGVLQETCRTFYSLPIFLLRRTFLGRLFPDSRIIREHLMRDWDHEQTREVDWCIGACLLARREAVDDVGMMDERFFMYFEDVDWCYRMHQRGWRVIYHPQSRMVHHYQRASAGWRPGRGLWIHLGSTLRYYEKWSFLLYWLKLRSRTLRSIALFLSDLFMVVLAFVLAYSLRSLASGLLTKPLFAFERYFRFLVFTVVVSMGTLLVFGLYRQRMRPSLVENGLPVARALGWTSVLMMAATFLFSVRVYSRMVVLLFYPLAITLVTFGRVAFLRLVESMRRRDLNLRRVGLIGPQEAVEELMDRFRRRGRFGMEPVPLLQGPSSGDAAAWIRRLRAERVQETVLFEDWQGDVPGLLVALREQGMPVRLVPALRGVLPVGSSLGEFMGWPVLALGGGVGRVRRGAGYRLADFLAAVGFFVLCLLPFLIAAVVRVVEGRPVTERVALRGEAGRPLILRRGAGYRTGAGFWRTVLFWYPALGSLVSGRTSLVGIYPHAEAFWQGLDPAYRERPPEAPVGLFGPWVQSDLEEVAWARWNQAYADQWSAAEDFRIFWRAVLGIRDSSGGAP